MTFAGASPEEAMELTGGLDNLPYEDRLRKEDLRQCLLESPCVLQENKSPKQCLREGHCRSLQVTFFACKRSMLDTRARFRGRKGY
ncbi:PREDICTED: cytochrome c oxidase assembly factor 5 [Corvus brachyrhynchos]|uniref:cytochrome c oxidase assembly factor 5 n=1 Tax=Corvus brachyrhynchos TaxID=85066 RepID=UPI0004DDEA4B|nr:PREDICTED: cytochrome c oxidase assembly factor 5 [Corvus brachyrhynchos]